MAIHEVELSIAEVKEAMRNDCHVFFSIYIADELTTAIPEFHSEIWDELLEMVRTLNFNTFNDHIHKLFCVPRGHAKSTVTKLAVILFMRYSPFVFTLYVSNTANIAKSAIKDIVRWFMSDNDSILFGKSKLTKANESDQLWELDIWTDEGKQKHIILKALGADQQVRGTLINNRRPELIIIDDAEDINTASTAESQMKLDVWLLGSLLKASARRSVRIMLGNMIKETTLLARLSKDKKWNPTVFGALIRDKKTGELRALWEGLYTVKQLLDDYAEFRRLGRGFVWLYEMMNMTEDSIIKTDLTDALRMPRPNPDQIIDGFICLDPAFGQKTWHDDSAFTVHVHSLVSPLVPMMVESLKGKLTEDQLLDEFIRLSYYWNLSTWVIESQAAQALLIPLFKGKLRERGIPIDIFTMFPITSGGVAKMSRIFSFQKSVANQSYIIAEEEEDFFQALDKYDPSSSKVDDLIDSGAYGPIAWGSAGKEIKEANHFKSLAQLLQLGTPNQSINQSDLVPF